MSITTIIATGIMTVAPVVITADTVATDSILIEEITAPVGAENHDVIHRLTEDDFKQAAEELGVDVPTIKAVINIEAGAGHQGFHAPGNRLSTLT